MNIEVNGVKITLTDDQLAEIAKQTSKKVKVEDLDYSLACKVLNKRERNRSDYNEEQEYLTHVLLTIIKAANYIDNGNKEWKPDFSESSRNYIPYLKKKTFSWVLYSVDCYASYSRCPLGFYYKIKKTAEIIVKKQLDLYNKVWD